MREYAKKHPEMKILQEINLCGFENKGFSKTAFKNLVEGIKNSSFVKKVALRENGINDECKEEIFELLVNTRITALDLSANKIGKETIHWISGGLEFIEKFE